MFFPIFRKYKYSVTNKEGQLEEHYYTIKIGLFDKRSTYCFEIVREDYCRILTYAEFLFHN